MDPFTAWEKRVYGQPESTGDDPFSQWERRVYGSPTAAGQRQDYNPQNLPGAVDPLYPNLEQDLLQEWSQPDPVAPAPYVPQGPPVPMEILMQREREKQLPFGQQTLQVAQQRLSKTPDENTLAANYLRSLDVEAAGQTGAPGAAWDTLGNLFSGVPRLVSASLPESFAQGLKYLERAAQPGIAQQQAQGLRRLGAYGGLVDDWIPPSPAEDDNWGPLAQVQRAGKVAPPSPREQAAARAVQEQLSSPAAQQELNTGLPLWRLPGAGSIYEPGIVKTAAETLTEQGVNPLAAMVLEMLLPAGPLEALGATPRLAGKVGKAANETAAKGGKLGKFFAQPIEDVARIDFGDLMGEASAGLRELGIDARAAAREAEAMQRQAPWNRLSRAEAEAPAKVAARAEEARRSDVEGAYRDLDQGANPLDAYREDRGRLRSMEEARAERQSPGFRFEDDPGVAQARDLQTRSQEALTAERPKPETPRTWEDTTWSATERDALEQRIRTDEASLAKWESARQAYPAGMQRAISGRVDDLSRSLEENRQLLAAIESDLADYRPTEGKLPLDDYLAERSRPKTTDELFFERRNGPARFTPEDDAFSAFSRRTQEREPGPVAQDPATAPRPENWTPPPLREPVVKPDLPEAQAAFRELEQARPARTPLDDLVEERSAVGAGQLRTAQEIAEGRRTPLGQLSAGLDDPGASGAAAMQRGSQRALGAEREAAQMARTQERLQQLERPATPPKGPQEPFRPSGLEVEPAQLAERAERLTERQDNLSQILGQLEQEWRDTPSPPASLGQEIRRTRAEMAENQKWLDDYAAKAPESDFQFMAPHGGHARGTGIQRTAPVKPPTAPAPGPPGRTPTPPRMPSAPINNPNVLTKVKSDLQVARELNVTLGRIAKNDFGNSPLDKARRWADVSPDSRITYGSAKGAKAPGAYSPKYDLITVAKAGDHGAVFHEAAHKVDHYTGFTKGAPADVLKELERMGDPATPLPAAKSGKSSWTPQQSIHRKREEGLAEFMRVWMEDPQWVRQNAPKLDRYWGEKLEEWNDVGRRLKQHQQDFQLFKNGTIVERTEAKIVRNAPDNPATPLDYIEGTFDRHVRFQILRDLVQGSTGTRLRPLEDPYHQARMLAGLDNKVEHWIDRGPMKWGTDEPIAGKRGLKQIFLDAGKERNDLRLFEHYLLHKRSEELLGRGIESGFDTGGLQDLEGILGTKKAQHFEKLAQEVYDYNDHLLQYMVESGAYSQETVDAMRKLNTAYVPFYRLFEADAGFAQEAAGGGGKGLNTLDPGRHRIKGSGREVYSPVENLIRNSGQMLQFAHKNAVGQTLAKLWDTQKPLVGRMFHEVEPGMVKAATVNINDVVSARKLRAELESIGVDFDTFDVSDKELRSLMALLPEKDVYRANNRLKDNWIRVRDKGEDRYFQLHPDFYRAWSALDEGQVAQFTKALSAVANVLRKGATTFNPGFLFFRNPARDTLEAGLASRSGFVPGLDTLKGMRDYLGKPDQWDEFVRTGGAQTFTEMATGSPEGARRAAQAVYDKLSPAAQEMTFLGRAAKPFKDAMGFILHQYERAGNVSEQATRMGEFARAKVRIAKENPSWAPHEVAQAAAFEARDLLDFSLRGANETLRNARRMIPFFGAGMNGMYRVGKAIKEDPRHFFGMGAVSMTLPTLANLAWNAQDPDYWQMPQQERDAFWHFRVPGATGDQKFIRIPKPHQPGMLFATLPERFAQHLFLNDKKAFDGLMQEFASKSSPVGWEAFGGPLGKTIIELGSNHDFFFRKDIESDYSKREHPASWLRSNEYSSATAKALAKALHNVTGTRGLSPIQIDHVIKSLTSYGGTNIVRNIIDPAVSAATGEELPKSNQRDPLGLFYKESRFESADRFEAEHKRLSEDEEAATASGKTFAEADRFREMETAKKRLKTLYRDRARASDPSQRDKLNREIRELTSKFTPAPGGKP